MAYNTVFLNFLQIGLIFMYTLILYFILFLSKRKTLHSAINKQQKKNLNVNKIYGTLRFSLNRKSAETNTWIFPDVVHIPKIGNSNEIYVLQKMYRIITFLYTLWTPKSYMHLQKYTCSPCISFSITELTFFQSSRFHLSRPKAPFSVISSFTGLTVKSPRLWNLPINT